MSHNSRKLPSTGFWSSVARLRSQFVKGCTELRVRAAIVVLVHTAIGIGLISQPERWERTPSYGILLNLFDQYQWGVCHLTVAVLMAGYLTWPQGRRLGVIAHTAAFVLIAVWLVAFIARYLTDPATTIVNVVSWTVYLYLVVRSALFVDEEKKP